MKERPILMSGPMVRAILDGRKTQTRRAINPQPKDDTDGSGHLYWRKLSFDSHSWPDNFQQVSEWGKPEDRLWVKETFSLIPKSHAGDNVIYRADGNASGAWKPSIFMPRWASRITLEVRQVRVERLQDISEEDAKSEGVATVREFMLLWDSINRKSNPWKQNAFVWVIVFKKL